jgi:AAHS family 4-hydroxybenzoate transporter-like MFS transporter
VGQQVGSGKSSDEAHVLRFLLVMLALVVEGFDLQAANFAGPSIAAGFGIARASLGPLLSASLVGILVGSTQIAPLGDRFGRKRILVLASAAFGALSLISAMAGSPTQLIVLRFLIGIGLGGVMPNALALAGEQFSRERQASMIGLVGIGISLGAVAAGVTAARILPMYGWRGLFVVGGILPVLIAIVIALAMPETSAARESRSSASVEALGRPGSVKAILKPAMRSMTVMIWVVFIGTTLTFYLLAGWIPLLLKGSGWSIAGAAWVTAGFHVGGVIGGVCASLALARGGWSTAAVFIGGAALIMIVLAFAKPGAVETIAFIIAAGFCTTGILNAINGATGGAYPPELRSTGLGWALGTGRVGSILGPLVGSVAALVNLDQNNRFFVIPVIPLVLVMILAIQLARQAALVAVLRK